MSKYSEEKEAFLELKKSFLNLDPVSFCEEYLMLDGESFKINGNGFKPFADVYRYIGVKCLEKTSKPVILLKARQIGGTILARNLQLYFMASGLFGNGNKPPIRVMHLFPSLLHVAAYSKTTLNPAIIGAKPSKKINKSNGIQKSILQEMLDKSSPTNDSLTFKQFAGGNHLWIESTGLDGDRLRGRTSDVLFYDEVQDINSAAINNTNKTLSASKYGPIGEGVQVYFGTPKGKGSNYHKMWDMSSQQLFYLGCLQCTKHFPLATPGSDDWEKIWLHGYIVKCPHCGHEQDKRKSAEIGKWITPEGININKCKFVGFHINQLYIPHFTKEYIISQKPENDPTKTERAYRNETLGEFFSGDSSTITKEEIIEFCGDIGRKIRPKISMGEEKMVIMGIDYGARSDAEQMANPENNTGGKSYSTAVIMSVKGPNLFNIEFAQKFQKNDLESKKGIIDQLMRQYSVNLAVGDIGFSHDFSGMLQTSYGNRYLVSRAVGSLNKHIRFQEDLFPKEIQFERNYYIEEFFELLKKGQIRFPLGSYEKMSWLLEHCSSMETKISLSKTSEHKINYVKGSKPNDGLMAALNCQIAYKFLVSNGFKTNNPFVQQQNFEQKSKPLIVGGYIQRAF